MTGEVVMDRPREPRTSRTGLLYYTLEDLDETPDDGRRYEVLDGELVVTPSPVPLHQRVSRNLFRIVDAHALARRSGEMFYAPLDVVFDEINVLGPDLLFISAKRLAILGEKNVQGSPDLVVEIVSKGTKKRDEVHKKAIYERFGVKNYWIVNPIERTCDEHVLRARKYAHVSHKTGSQVFRPRLWKGLSIKLADLWT